MSSAAPTPGTSRIVENAVEGSSTPSSPLLSLLLSSAPKPPELQYKQLAKQEDAGLPDVSAIAALIDDNATELKQVEIIVLSYLIC
jgi:hypothetical protein